MDANVLATDFGTGLGVQMSIAARHNRLPIVKASI